MRSVVLLPQPLGPSNVRTSPALTSNDTSSTTRKAPYDLVSPRTRRTGPGDDGAAAVSVKSAIEAQPSHASALQFLLQHLDGGHANGRVVLIGIVIDRIRDPGPWPH